MRQVCAHVLLRPSLCPICHRGDDSGFLVGPGLGRGGTWPGSRYVGGRRLWWGYSFIYCRGGGWADRRPGLAKQFADQGKFCLCSLVAAVETERLIVGLACHLGVHVTEIFVRNRVTGMRVNRHFQGLSRLVVLPLSGVQNRKIVVRFGQTRKVASQVGENPNRCLYLVSLSQYQALEETRPGVSAVAGDGGIDFFKSSSGPALPE